MAEMTSGQCCIQGLQFSFAGVTDPGLVRSCNEDSLLLMPEVGVFAVADGLGGLDAGDLASSMTLDLIREHVERQSAATASAGWVARWGGRGKRPCLEAMIDDVNNRLYEERIALKKNMATTLVVVQLCRQEISVGHVGDSRLYCRRNGELNCLTRDHSLVGELQRQGVMTAEQARVSPQKHVITRAIGAESTIKPTVETHPLNSDDVYCLCTDGLTSMLDDEAINVCFEENSVNCSLLAQSLVDRAIAAGGRDNITVVVLSIT